MEKATKQDVIIDFCMITLGILIATIGVYFFLLPANLVVGSVTGLALVIIKIIPISISAATFVLNMGLLVIGYIVVGKEFGTKTVYTSVLFPVLLYIFEKIYPNQQAIMGDPWLELLTFVLILGVAQTILFNSNASSGGIDVVAKVFNHLWGIPIGTAISIASGIVSLSAIFFYDTKTVILGFIGTYLNGLIVSHFTDAFNQKRRVCIISKEHELIANYILTVLSRGVTMYPTIGGYTKKDGLEIQIIIENSEVIELIRYINDVDENAFVTVGSVSLIKGRWNRKKDIKDIKGKRNN